MDDKKDDERIGLENSSKGKRDGDAVDDVDDDDEYPPSPPKSDQYSPSSWPYYEPSSPFYEPSSPFYEPGPPPNYTPPSPTYYISPCSPTSPNYDSPSSSTYSDFSPLSPNYNSPTSPALTYSELRKSIQTQTEVALGITKEVLFGALGKVQNVVYSPLSIHVVLSMIVAGAKPGEVQDKMLRFLKSKSLEELNHLASIVVPLVFADGSSSGGPCLSIANGVWVEKTLAHKACFRNNTAYKVALNKVDFKTRPEEVRCQVNSWAEKETRGLITEILPPGTVTSTTEIILGNALYFKGAWNQKFNALETREYNFNLLGNTSVKAPFMTSTNDQYIRAFDGFKVLRLPYKQGGDFERRFAMYVFLPKARDGLQDLVERFCSQPGFIDRHLPRSEVPVCKFLIPKFKMSYGFEVLPVLESVGLGPGDIVGNMLHKSLIEVNEEGTEAAAVTVFSPSCSSTPPPPPPIDFVANHPFLYLIREDVTETVMFIGHVLNPTAEA